MAMTFGNSCLEGVDKREPLLQIARGVTASSLNGCCDIKKLPDWQLKRGLINALHNSLPAMTARRLRAKLDAKRAAAAAIAAGLD